MSCGFPLTTTLKQRKGKIKSQSSRPMDARRRSRWWQIRNYRVVKAILEALEKVTARNIVSCRLITGPTVAQMKLNVSLETRKFSFHHMFNALEWNKVSNQYCGLGRTHGTRLGRCCCRHAKIVKNWLNAALRRLWILREIRRCSKILLLVLLFERK